MGSPNEKYQRGYVSVTSGADQALRCDAPTDEIAQNSGGCEAGCDHEQPAV